MTTRPFRAPMSTFTRVSRWVESNSSNSKSPGGRRRGRVQLIARPDRLLHRPYRQALAHRPLGQGLLERPVRGAQQGSGVAF